MIYGGNYRKSYSRINNPWHKKAIFSNTEKIVFGSLYGFILGLIFLIGSYFFELRFVWENVSPFEVPTLIPRIFLSALSYVGPGAIFYYLKIYQVLYRALPYKTFIEVKASIWFCFSAFVYVFIEIFVEFLNHCASIFFNSYHFFIFIYPIFGTSVGILMIVIFGYLKYIKQEGKVIY